MPGWWDWSPRRVWQVVPTWYTLREPGNRDTLVFRWLQWRYCQPGMWRP